MRIWNLAPVALMMVLAAAAQTPPDQPPQKKQQRQPPAPRPFELQAESPKFWDLFDKDVKMDKVAGGFGFTEGPVWDEKNNYLYVSDEEKNQVDRVYPDGRVETVLSIGDPDGATFDKRRRLIETASVLRAMIAVAPDGKYTVLADKYEGKKLNSPNDVVLGPDGALYFTDPTYDLVKGEKQELDYQGIFRMTEQGELKLLAKDMSQPNGLAFSPDGKLLYVDDTKSREIRVYDFVNGEMKNGRLFAQEEGRGGPDGMKVDVQGNLYATGPNGVWIWDKSGTPLGKIIVPEGPANLGWGDSDWKTLYVCGRTTIYKVRTKIKGFVPYAQ